MSTINKVPASAGAEWLLAGFALLKRAPLPLVGMALLWQFLALIAGLIAMAAPAAGAGLQVILVLAQPLFLGGLIWVVRELDEGRAVTFSLLLQPVRDGKGVSLWMSVLMPQIIIPTAMVLSLFLLIGPSGFDQVMAVLQKMQASAVAGQPADPSLLDGLPQFRLVFWVLVLLPVLFILMLWLIFLVVPEVVFSGRRAFDALRNSLKACAQNWAAVMLFYLLAIIAGIVLSICAMMLIATLQLLGAGILAGPLIQLAMAIFLPIYVSATYYAWRQIIGGGSSDEKRRAPASTHIEV